MPPIPATVQASTSLAITINCILVVEDQPVAAEVVKQILTDLHCRVDVAPNGSNALLLAKQKQYDLIFMDIGLPDIDGYEITKQIRIYENTSAHKVPIVALTAHADLESKELCLTAGMNAVLTKPLLKKQAMQILEIFLPKGKNPTLASSQNASSYTPQEEVVNYQVAKAILGQDEIIKKVLIMLASNLAEEKTNLEEAYVKKDWKKIQEIAHKFSGGASYCGALRLEKACSTLKDCIAKDNLEIGEIYYHKMHEEMHAFTQFITNGNI